jgi:TRAP-type uncharacterized transport system fused permease subunit
MSAILEFFDSFLQNQWVVAIIAIALAVYVVLKVPDLVASPVTVIKNNVFLLLVIFVISFISTRNATIAFLMSLAFITWSVGKKCIPVFMEERQLRLTSGGTPMNINWKTESLAGGIDLATASEEDLDDQGFYKDTDFEQYAPA